MRTRQLDHRYFAVINTEEKAYWLGFLAADGCVSGNRVSLALAERDADHVAAFRVATGSTHAITPFCNRGYVADGSRGVVVSFRSKEMCDDLASHGITPRKSLTAAAWNGPPALMPHYWRGVIDGDGWISNATDPLVGLVGSEAMVRAFREYGTELTGSEMHPRARGKVWVVQFYFTPCQTILRALYSKSLIALPRKKAKAEEVLSRPCRVHRDLSHYDREQVANLLANHGSWSRAAVAEGMSNASMRMLGRRFGLISSKRA